jgi:hypothetical protein
MKKILLTIILISLWVEIDSNSPIFKVAALYVKPPIAVNTKDFLLEEIKKHEGFCAVPTNCGDGLPSIGYGCVIKFLPKYYLEQVYFELKTKGFITEELAGEILRYQFEGCLKLVNKYYPNLSGNKALATAHMVYALGICTLLNHQIIQNDTLNTQNLLYLSTFKGKFHPLAYKLRLLEIKIFNQNENTIAEN